MSFDALGRYNPNHKVWDHVGNLIPDIGHSEGQVPAIELKVASWLPVQFFDKHYENWMVVMPGKAIALDPNGDAMPAQYGATTTPSVVYTQNDIDNGVIDVSTGLPVESIKTVALAKLTGVKEAGWTKALAGVTKTSGFMGIFGRAWPGANGSTVSLAYPIGIAPYAYLQWCGGDGVNPAGFRQHNYNMQHLVAVLCDYVIKLPLVPGQVASEAIDTSLTASALVSGTRAAHGRAYAQACASGRYDKTTGSFPVLDTYPVVALALDNASVAKQTMRTTFAMVDDNGPITTVLVNEMSSLAAVRQAGDYWVDYDYGVIFIYSSDGASLPTALDGVATSPLLTYYVLGAAPSVLSKFSCVLAGSVVPGDFLKVGTDSNLVRATTEDFKSIVGQVLGFETYPRDGLERVRTSFTPALNTNSAGSMANGVAGGGSVNLGQMDQMAGTATGGVPDQIHFAGAADQLVIINLISR